MKKYYIKKEGYEYIKYLGLRSHLLKYIEADNLEVWYSNPDFAGYQLTYKNTRLEFGHSYNLLNHYEN